MTITMLPHVTLTPAVMLRLCMMKVRDLVVALDINYGTYVRHTKRDEKGLMTFAMENDTS